MEIKTSPAEVWDISAFFVHHSAVGFVVEIIGCHRWARVAEASCASEDCRAWCGWYFRASLFKWDLCCELQDWQAFGRLKCTTGINGTVLHFVACKYIQNQLDGTVLFLKFSSSCHYTSPFIFLYIYLLVMQLGHCRMLWDIKWHHHRVLNLPGRSANSMCIFCHMHAFDMLSFI